MKIRQVPDPILRKKAKPIKKIDKEVLAIIKKLEKTLKSLKKGVAIAAPQIGISKAIVFAQYKKTKKKDVSVPRTILINPKIVKYSKEKVAREEGCLSFDKPQIRAVVKRSRRVVVSALNEKGAKKIIKSRGFMARVMQHEIDHLNGILFVDRADPTTLYKVSEKEKNDNAVSSRRSATTERSPLDTQEISPRSARRNDKQIKIIFFGSDSFSVPILEALLDNFEVALVVTKSDREAGRGKKSTANPVKRFVETKKINFVECHSALDAESINKIKKVEVDIYVVAAFGLMIPKSLLKSPAGVKTINVHPSLLPLYRGPSPIESAILAGDKKTGVSIMVLDEKMDHGPIISQEEEAIDDEYDDFITLSERLEKRGADLLVKVIADFIAGKIKLKRQNDTQATYCQLIKKEDGRLDFKQDASQILYHIRAFIHWPGSFCRWQEKNKIIKIVDAHLQTQLPEPPFTAGMVFKTSNGKPAIICGKQAIIIETLQIEGKKPVDSISFLNGYPDFIGANLG